MNTETTQLPQPGYWSPDGYIKACRFAADAHQGQTLPGSPLPYVIHVGLVSMEVMAVLPFEVGRDGDLAVQCALLHDIIEDTACSYAQIRNEFGPRVADGVLALTKDQTLARSLQMTDSLQRIRQQPAEVWMVKLADRITNLQPPPSHWSRDRARQYREESLEIYQSLKDASPLLAARLHAKIETYTQYYT